MAEDHVRQSSDNKNNQRRHMEKKKKTKNSTTHYKIKEKQEEKASYYPSCLLVSSKILSSLHLQKCVRQFLLYKEQEQGNSNREVRAVTEAGQEPPRQQ